jgi:diguanylate cyclase (GGDEF)-like protein
MRKRIGLFGASDEALALIPLLEANPAVELAKVYDPEAARLRERFGRLDPGVAGVLEGTLVDDPHEFAGSELDAVVVASPDDLAAALPEGALAGVRVVTPLTAKLLWGYNGPPAERKAELLQILHEIVESVDLTIDTDELFARVLEIALAVTGAEGGSLMLLDEAQGELRVRVAAGIEPELWSKIRVRLGEGIAGRVAEEGRSLRLRGKADRARFRIVRERLDVESALCVPLLSRGRVQGVLNLHHRSRPDAFDESDLAFAEELARVDAQIIARAQEHADLRSQAARYTAVREVRQILGERTPLDARLSALCGLVARHAGGGIATVYLHDLEEDALRCSATSSAPGSLLAELRIRIGEGIDGAAAENGEATLLHHADGALAYAALPLFAGDHLVGVLSVQAGASVPRDARVEETLREIASVAAEEIAKAEREARTAHRATQIGAINEAGLQMVSATDPSEVLRLATSSAAMTLEADHAVLRLQDEETRRFAIRSYFGSADGRTQERLFKLDKRVSVEVLRRRAPVWIRDLAAHPELGESGSDVRSLIAAPLTREGRPIGTLALYDKIAPDRFTPSRFAQDDLRLFEQFVSYLERALANALLHARTRQLRHFDEETGLPNDRHLARRIEEELARAGSRDGALALAVAKIENLAEFEAHGDAQKTRRLVARVAESLRARARDFDVVARLGPAEFAVLMPEPGRTPGERVALLARAVAEDVSKDDDLNDPTRVSLSFGYASAPADGRDRKGLLEAARTPRIHMV